MTWNRLYRPATVEQLHITSVREQLEKIVKSGKIPPVFLFTGPKGTGKTSAARILALLVNDPKNQDIFINQSEQKYNSPDVTSSEAQKILQGRSFVVQELDAASNRGIDDIRSLKERLAVPPMPGQTTVIILDEVHMLTTEAHNALLKILEEPPAYVMFILATTELHKIPETIVSRCQVINFREATLDELKIALTKILKTEKIEFEADALDLIVKQARGSFRDAIKVTELISLQGKVTVDTFTKTLGPLIQPMVDELLLAVTSKQTDKIINIFETLRTHNTNADVFFETLLLTLHSMVIGHYRGQTIQPLSLAVSQFLLKQLLAVSPNHTIIPFLPLELQILEIVSKAQQQNNSGKSSSGGSNTSANTSLKASPPVKRIEILQAERSRKEIIPVIQDSVVEVIPMTLALDLISTSDIVPAVASEILHVSNDELTNVDLPIDLKDGDNFSVQYVCDNWKLVVEALAKENPSISALLQSAIPLAEGHNQLTIQVFYAFHQEQLKQQKFSQIINNIVNSISNSTLTLKFGIIARATDTSQDGQLIQAATEHLM